MTGSVAGAGLRLDHLVINAHFELEALQGVFEGLGFELTPRGRHTLGSINHLAVFPSGGYLELIGLPNDGGKLREEILKSPVGIDGLVFGSDDAEETHAALAAAGFRTTPVQHFSRPVEHHGLTEDARFSTVRLLPGQLAAGRVYICQQHTPELVWRPEWMHHREPISAIEGLVVVARNPQAAERDYARLGTLARGFSLEFVDRDGFAQRYGPLARYAPDRDDFFGAIRWRASSTGSLARRATQMGLPVADTANQAGIAIAVPAFHALLEFTV